MVVFELFEVELAVRNHVHFGEIVPWAVRLADDKRDDGDVTALLGLLAVFQVIEVIELDRRRCWQIL